MRTTLTALEASRAHRPAGYVDAILAAGRLDPDGEHHHITPEALVAIRSQYGIPEPPLPSLPQMARNATAALARNLRAATARSPLTVSADDRARRQEACMECEWFRPVDQRCSQCGCGMTGVVGKWRLAEEHCPLGQW